MLRRGPPGCAKCRQAGELIQTAAGIRCSPSAVAFVPNPKIASGAIANKRRKKKKKREKGKKNEKNKSRRTKKK